jgi:hydrogenase expression/formation protein HypD
MAETARDWLQRIRALPLPPRVKIMNVCGGHERSITMAGLRNALHEDIILVAYGDMLRVPVNVRRCEARTLEEARAKGADVRPISSPQEAARIARDNTNKPVIFFAAGFETTTAPTAALLVEGAPDNLFILLSGRLTWPAVAMLLESGTPGFDALVAPGHVATIMGPEEWEFVVKRHDGNLSSSATTSRPPWQVSHRKACWPRCIPPCGN